MSDVKMGKALQRAKKKRQLANRANFQAILEQENQMHEQQNTAPKLRSVWQTTNLDDVLEAAGEREEGYAALRDVRLVVGGAVHVVAGDKVVPQTTEKDEDATSAKQRRDWLGLSEKLPIPERPSWNFRMSADEVQQRERQAFVEWRRDLARIEEADKVLMTPFEKNVEVWRQLWRVVEKSDVVMQIVDARNPLAFRSAGFERYVKRHQTRKGESKPCILLLNKADLLTENQRRAWAAHLEKMGLRFFFFSARASTEAIEQRARENGGAEGAEEQAQEDENGSSASASDSDDDVDAKMEGTEAAKARVRREAGIAGGAANKGLEEERHMTEAMRKAAAQRAAEAAQPKKDRRRKDRRLQGAPTKVENPYAMRTLKDDAEERKRLQEVERAKEKPLTLEELERDRRLKASIADRFRPWDLLDPVTLLDALAVMREELGVAANSEPIMVGLTGYPNVGKSSTINAIMQSKKVVVSATPGKTKHFQTLPIPNERRLILCDCPGLVFPSFATTKEAMVCDGILPVDTCRDYLAAVAVVCDRIPRPVLERTYFVVLDKDLDVDESATRAELFLNYMSRRKGYMTEHDKPNRYRSAQIVLKDYVDGKVVYVHPPPGLVLSDPRPIPEPKKSKMSVPRKAAEAAPAAADADAAEGEEGWETASDDDDGDDDEAWEDFDGVEADRALSDAGDSEASEEEELPLTFYGNTRPNQWRRMTTAEVFNLEHNYAIAEAPLDLPRPRRKKVNPQLVPDETYRINRHGDKELLLDEDDEIVICGLNEAKEKKLSKRQNRRQAKRGLVAARGAKPAALPGAYEARSALQEDVNATPSADF